MYMSQEDIYLYEYTKFKNNPQNKDKTEFEFLDEYSKKVLDIQNEYLRIYDLNDNEVLEHIKQINFRGYNNFTIEQKNKKNISDIDFINEFRKYHLQKKPTFPISEQYLKLVLERISMPIKILDLHSKQTDKTEPKSKSLLLNGKKLNLLDRFTLANKVLKMETEIRKLNIQDLEKYKLVALILGCNEDNARDLMNGKYNAKPNDLTDYFNGLGLNE